MCGKASMRQGDGAARRRCGRATRRRCCREAIRRIGRFAAGSVGAFAAPSQAAAVVRPGAGHRRHGWSRCAGRAAVNCKLRPSSGRAGHRRHGWSRCAGRAAVNRRLRPSSGRARAIDATDGRAVRAVPPSTANPGRLRRAEPVIVGCAGELAKFLLLFFAFGAKAAK